MKRSIVWKLLAINLLVIAAVMVVVWLTIDYLAADYFTTLMETYNISPTASHRMFVDAVHRYMVQAGLAALVVVGGLSFFLTRRILRPLARMTEVTRGIAAGDYSARVPEASEDEVGDLARAFNRMADSLERIQALRKNMVSDISHELRTPLTNVRGYLEALADGVVPPERETYQMLQREILRLVRLVDDLQQLTKADAARAHLSREEVSLPDLVTQVAELYGQRFRARGITVGTRIGEGAGRVSADRDKLAQALSNLIENACQYATEGGRVEIAADRGADGITLTVTNTGEGIAADDLPFIFERFYRADRSRSRESGGAGIGLAIVKELIEAHGGQVGAASEDGETRLWFTLPAPAA